MNHDPKDSGPFWVMACMLGLMTMCFLLQTCLQLVSFAGALLGGH